MPQSINLWGPWLPLIVRQNAELFLEIGALTSKFETHHLPRIKNFEISFEDVTIQTKCYPIRDPIGDPLTIGIPLQVLFSRHFSFHFPGDPNATKNVYLTVRGRPVLKHKVEGK